MLDDCPTEELQEGPGASMKHITCIEDLRQVHMRKVPKAFFDYADRGSYAEETLRANPFWWMCRSAISRPPSSGSPHRCR
jgi:L-lactate dehydrogenase (cytochrome)